MSVPQAPSTIARSTLERPSVTMITEMIGSPIIGRRISRSIARPRMIEKTIVSATAHGHGACACTIAQKTYAPRSRNSPWAKFSTPLDL